MSSAESQQNTQNNITNFTDIIEKEKTIIRVEKDKSHPYVMINKTGALDVRLSAKARGMLAACLCMPDDWIFRRDNFFSLFKESKDALNSGLKELEDFGYMLKTYKKRDGGRFPEWDIKIFESPHLNPSINQDSNQCGKPAPVEPVRINRSGKPATTNNITNLNTKPSLNNNNNKGPLPFSEMSKTRTPGHSQKPKCDYQTTHAKQSTIENAEKDVVVVSLFNRLNKLPNNLMTLSTLQSLAQSHDLKKIEAKVRGMEIMVSRSPGSVRTAGAFLISALKDDYPMPTDEDLKTCGDPNSEKKKIAEENLARVTAISAIEHEKRLAEYREMEKLRAEAKQNLAPAVNHVPMSISNSMSQIMERVNVT